MGKKKSVWNKLVAWASDSKKARSKPMKEPTVKSKPAKSKSSKRK